MLQWMLEDGKKLIEDTKAAVNTKVLIEGDMTISIPLEKWQKLSEALQALLNANAVDVDTKSAEV